MHDASVVRRRQPVQELAGDRDDRGGRQLPFALEPARQRLAVQEFTDHVA